MEAVLVASLTIFSTLLGGLFAFRYKDRLHRILGFSAGVVLGVVAFEILPEIVDLLKVNDVRALWPMLALVCGFLLFHIIEKSILLHKSQEEDYGSHHHPHVGLASSIALAAHSFLDGVGIGLGFQVSPSVGFAVAIAVIAHDFTDGLNTVSLMLMHKNDRKRTMTMLFIDAFTPILGAISTLFFTVSDFGLILYLGFFAGFLLYIGASEILPEAHSEHSSYRTIGLTVLGAATMLVVSLLFAH